MRGIRRAHVSFATSRQPPRASASATENGVADGEADAMARGVEGAAEYLPRGTRCEKRFDEKGS